MREEVVAELNRRTDVIIANTPVGKRPIMVVWFDTVLAPVGYPFDDAPDWMDWADADPVMDMNEYHANTYGDVILDCFTRAMEKIYR